MASRYPPFSWSHSRDRTLITCARRYYWQYYGRLDPDPELAQWAWVLRHLTTLDLTLGSVVHNIAREDILSVRGGQSPTDQETMLQRARLELNRVCLSSHHRDAFVRFPTESPMLQDVWYTGRRDEHATERVREKMLAVVAHLSASPMWDELARLGSDQVLVVDSLSSFLFEGIPVYAAPDLAYRPNSPDAVPSASVIGNLTVVDWKTGGHCDDADLQLGVYALGLVLGHGITFEDPWIGRVVLLATGEEAWYEITALDLARAKQRIRSSIATMQDLLIDPACNVPLPREAFPLAAPERRSRCPSCPFFQLCQEELARTEDEGEHRMTSWGESTDSLRPSAAGAS